MATNKTDLIRVNLKDKEYLESLGRELNESVSKVIHRMVEEHRINKFLAEYNASYLAQRQDGAGWESELQERKLFNNTLSDGLKDQ